MRPTLDLTNQRFGRLRILHATRAPNGKKQWLCECDCGNSRSIEAHSLLKGKSTSCGCFHREVVREFGKRATHGHTRGRKSSAEYATWRSMIVRCYNKKNSHYARYGGRGISVCATWIHSFEQFLADMGPRPASGLSIDRIQNDGNYEPNNCRWANKVEQCSNKKQTIKIKIDGASVSLKQAACLLGVSYQTVQYRRRCRGMTPEQALGLEAIDGMNRPVPADLARAA